MSSAQTSPELEEGRTMVRELTIPPQSAVYTVRTSRTSELGINASYVDRTQSNEEAMNKVNRRVKDLTPITQQLKIVVK